MSKPDVTADAKNISDVGAVVVDLICPAGKYFPPGTTEEVCLNCPAEKYQTQPGAEICKSRAPCSPGMFKARQDVDGNALPPKLCDVCPAGKMSVASDSPSCTMCPVSEYQPEDGQVFCLPCPAHATTLALAPTIDQCVCDPEYFMVKEGSWIQGVWEGMSRAECRPCVEGADCSLQGTTVPTLRTLPGWWRAGIATIHFDSMACEETTCSSGYFQPVCPGCDPAAYNNSNITSGRETIAGPSDVQCAIGQAGLMCLLCDRANR